MSDVHLWNEERYRETYAKAKDSPEEFWSQIAQRLHWDKPFTKVKDTSYERDDVHIRWFEDGELNVAYNCIDRHLADHAESAALLWVSDDGTETKTITYQELHDEVARLANVLLKQGFEPGDRILIYMPMVPQAVYSMLACARLGLVHSVVFAGFSPNAIADRIRDSKPRAILTSNEGLRGGKTIPLKNNIDRALEQDGTDSIETVIVHRRTDTSVDWNAARDRWYHDLVSSEDAECPCQPFNAEHPLFILYTSGSTGKPKGVLHTTGGYLTYASYTHETVFNYQPGKVYWCNADIGWITGHSYVVYGPLANRATVVIHEGIPMAPKLNQMSQIIDDLGVNILYTAPTAIRALMAKGDKVVEGTHRKSLELLGSVGEPINPEAWRWYHETIGEGRCSIVDTWWQTETGGILISPIPGVLPTPPGAATQPLPGIKPALLSAEGSPLEGPAEGALVITDSWPGQMRTVYGDHQRFVDTYFSTFPGHYFTGDGARRDEDGNYWITGRMDDVLNVSGHRLGTAEVESALVAHPSVAEAAVVGFPHPIKGQGIYAYVVNADGTEAASDDALKQQVSEELSAIAKPDLIQWTTGLPKTRSGKIMRRILRKVAEGAVDQLGDISTLADHSVIEALVQNRKDLTQ